MPNYAYYCVACDNETEKNVTMNDRDDQDCDTCHRKLKKKFRFNGSVWSPTRNGGHS